MVVAALPHRIGVLGKTPRHAEFVRHNTASPLAQQLHRWLEEGMARVQRARAELPATPHRFVFTAPGQSTALVGVLTASADSVGRGFPLVVFTELSVTELAERYALLPEAFEPFLRAGSELVQEAPRFSIPELLERAALLNPPRPGDFKLAERLKGSILSEHSCAELLKPVCTDTPPEARYYALHTFLTACAGEHHREQGLAQVVLDCPLDGRMGPTAWLELASRLLGWTSMAPGFLWSEGSRPRLLLCLGAPTSALLLYVAQPDLASSQLWPLRTERAAALASAKRALTPAQRQVLDSSTSSIEQLLRAVARKV
ncbi:type VI secretion system-associated protein TagF [Corallococcus llansteffanensis]|uniref:Type VI secretion system-associated protein TagF n=1 Tax=Corallococcus llansteffanensis TaxID=2316731 RepID=A0A3A8NJV7_9BACT|nr:type VI secretion system-associated protein TagF [Corallococcus llansteffanensis]RKH44617.1 type VI secretion system-associated protein TagF [Corallococcus llansteffanensis]